MAKKREKKEVKRVEIVHVHEVKKKKHAKKRKMKRIVVEKGVEKALAENLIALEKIMANLSVKFDGLSNQISKLLELFEASAKALAQKEFKTDKEDKSSKELVGKLDNLLEQNKIIAKGVMLLHDGGVPMANSSVPTISGQQQMQPPTPMANEGYQPSISNKPVRFNPLPR